MNVVELKAYLARVPGQSDVAQACDAAESMYRALQNMPDICIREAPYSGKIVQQCPRCAAMEKWENVMLVSDMPGSRKRERLSVKV